MAASCRRGWRIPFVRIGVILCLVGMTARGVSGDEVTLPSRIVLQGKSQPIHGLDQRSARQNREGALPELFLMVDDGVRRYFVPSRLCTVNKEANLAGVPEFNLPRTRRARSMGPELIGTVVVNEPFDEFGKRTVSLQTTRGPISIIQEITRLRPDYVEVEGVNYIWTQALDTRLLPAERLIELLHRAARKDNIDDRKAIIRFCLDSRRWDDALREMQQLLEDHPDLREWGEPQLPLIAEQKYRAAIVEVQRRQKVGQHQLASRMAQIAPPDKVPADAMRQCEELAAGYRLALEQAGEVGHLLEQYESELPEAEAQRLRPMRRALMTELSYDNLSRLSSFLEAKQDTGLTASQKLAMAYSAWVVGVSYADINLQVAFNLWDARFLALEYIRCHDDPARRQEISTQIKGLEGVTIERMAQLIPLLPYVFEEQPPLPGVAHDCQATLEGGLDLRYTVVLPAEYHPSRTYPTIIALHQGGRTPQEIARWWAGTAEQPGQAMNRGYIVIAPQYCEPESRSYEYDQAAHRLVVGALTDARKRYSIDSDRIFLAGHEMGADAVYDIATTRPDLFAGVIPMVGKVDRYPRVLATNGARLPWYIVAGERDRDTLARNVPFVNSLVRGMTRADMIYCEYKGRGLETYHEEQPRLFDWMDAQQRRPLRELRDGWSVDLLRRSEDQFYWVKAVDLPERLGEPILWSQPKTIPRPMEVSSRVLPNGNTMYVTVPGGRGKSRATIWLSPDLVSFEKRLTITINSSSRPAFNSTPQPEITDMLEDFRIRADRQRLYWARLEL